MWIAELELLYRTGHLYLFAVIEEHCEGMMRGNGQSQAHDQGQDHSHRDQGPHYVPLPAPLRSTLYSWQDYTLPPIYANQSPGGDDP